MVSERLTYEPVAMDNLERFHTLVQDPHVLQYLMDGETMTMEWSAARVRDSTALFARRGVGLWLVHEIATGELAGFCGFIELATVVPDPQLVYALRERATRRGYATEMARAAITRARTQPGFAVITAGVDAPNVASLRVLEKLGFERYDVTAGHFGTTIWLRLNGALPPASGHQPIAD